MAQGVFARPGGARSDEAGILAGDRTVHTTDSGQADVTVRQTSTSQGLTRNGSLVPCASEQDSRKPRWAMAEVVWDSNGAAVARSHWFGERP